MEIGNKIKCDNGKTYTLAKGRYYTFALIDELGVEVNLIHDYALEDCLPFRKEYQRSLCVGENEFGELDYTRIIEVVERSI